MNLPFERFLPRTREAGRAWPLGATPTPRGVNFAVFAPDAHAIELCLFDAAGQHEVDRIALDQGHEGIWHAHLAGAGSGLVYGYRAYGPWQPQQGLRFNPAKLLLDPYARDVVGRYAGSDLMLDMQADGSPDHRDNASVALKARVQAEPAPLRDDQHRHVAPEDRVIYEAHIRAATRLHPGVPPALRGSYAGFGHDTMIEHLLELGITTVCLMPMMLWLDESRLLAMGLRNHWGYNPAAWFCVEPRLWSGRHGSTPLAECREMVSRLHAAGLEVISDVVFNHSAEGDLAGPTLHLRGLANRQYYHLDPHDGRHYRNWSGCGNSMNLAQPRTLQLAMDAMRYWVQCIGVDGFRFDLAPILARDAHDYRHDASFFAAVRQDPVLQAATLIAEPWDIGPGGYRLGAFPSEWHEWNDRYRDTMRRWWLHGGVPLADFAQVLAGSSGSFDPGRKASTSVNLITAHDGFNLTDLVSYHQRRNEANGENNRDGHGDNHSSNCGEEGPSASPEVRASRLRLRQALLATLAVSVGTPQLLAGDEIGHSQKGNNNAYCQDNPITWLDWAGADAALTATVRDWFALRKEYDELRPRHWLHPGRVRWLHPDGREMYDGDWHCPHGRALALAYLDERGHATLVLAFNAAPQGRTFHLPGHAPWRIRLATHGLHAGSAAGQGVEVPPQCVVAFEPTPAQA
jgi:glycogen operon protein